MPDSSTPPNFLRTPSESADDYLADRIADSVVEHLPAPVRDKARATVRRPLARRLWRVLWIVLLSLYFAFGLLILALRYWILPQVGEQRPQIERFISEKLQRPVRLSEIEAHWVGLQPALRFRGLDIQDGAGQTALWLERVDARLAWDSLWHLAPRLAQLEIDAPDLTLRRDALGRLYVAGMRASGAGDDGVAGAALGGEDSGLADLLLGQHRIIVRNARVRWIDEQRQAPELILEQLDFRLDNDGARHRFGLTAVPPAAYAGPLDLRGDLRGKSFSRLADWKGELYLRLDAADLAVWQQWVDYPVWLPNGHGALELWVNLARAGVARASADLRLKQVKTRLRGDLPALDLQRLHGRIGFERLEKASVLRLERLELHTRDGIRLAPTDFELRYEPRGEGEQVKLRANQLDLGVLTRLASHLPLPAQLAKHLAASAGSGHIGNLKLDWRRDAGPAAAPLQWTLDADFNGLAMQAVDALPGFSGISGRVSGNQDSGHLNLTGESAAVRLPAVFEDAEHSLGQLAAGIDWGRQGTQVAVNLRRLRLTNADFSAELSGTWRPAPDGQGPGVIDLTARVPQVAAEAVWRYIPRAAGSATRPWLRQALRGGEARNAALTLKGDLRHFPFRDPAQGRFEVRAEIHGAVLDYAEAWPLIEGIDGDLLFAGPRMLIKARQGRVFGTTLRDVRAEIADLEPIPTLLAIKGQAAGPTAEFLRFIEASPVGEAIDHFTRETRAEGEGQLDLALDIPLEHPEQTKVAGTYRFERNTLHLVPGLPPIVDARGKLGFSGDELSARNLQGQWLGGGASGEIRTSGGVVQVSARGEATAAALRSETGLALFDHLSGATRWSANLRIGKRGVEASVESNLQGLASQLPPPFAKAAADTRALRFERAPWVAPSEARRAPVAKVGAGETARPAPGSGLSRDEFSIAGALRLQLLRDTQGRIQRGLLALGRDPAQLPERDLLLTADLAEVDLDFWRRALRREDGANDELAAGSRPPIRFDLRAGKVRLLDKDFNDLRMSGENNGSLTRFELRSQAFSANLNYDSRDAGRLWGVIPRLAIPESAEELAPGADSDLRGKDVVKRLPAIDLRIDRLSYKQRELGQLTLAAENRRGGPAQWDARVDLKNPDAAFSATVVWRPEDQQAQTQAAFSLVANHLDKTFDRLGFVDTLRRGSARVDGTLSWDSAPVDLDYATLTGSFQLAAEKGQFNKLEPGVAGRLLGILSLQTLPRRITLDFRDVFSEGFAFDGIVGDIAVRRGVMFTDDLRVDGPAASVTMKGQVDLAKETQNLTVRVKPALGDTVAIGALIAANPVAGAVAWATQKIFDNPLGTVFAYEYAISGDWADPKVDKLDGKKRTEGSAKP